MHFQTKVLIVSVLIVCVMAGAIGSFWYRQTSKQAQSSAERYIGSVLERLNGSFETMLRDVDHLVICASIDTNHIVNFEITRRQLHPKSWRATRQFWTPC